MGKDVNSVINTCFFSVLLQLVSVFIVLNGQLLNKHQMRLLLQNPGGTFLQIQTDI